MPDFEFVWTLPQMAPNETDTLQIPIALRPGGSGDELVATADVEPATLQQIDPDASNNTASATTTLT